MLIPIRMRMLKSTQQQDTQESTKPVSVLVSHQSIKRIDIRLTRNFCVFIDMIITTYWY